MTVVDQSFVTRFEELHRVGYRAAYAVLGSRPDAEECAQEACARALVRWRRVEGHAPAWVARVATNQALDRARRQGRADRAMPRLAGSDDPGAGAADDRAVLAERRRDLVVALNALPRKQREMVVLRHLADLSEQQTADVLNCSVGTVKSSTARGLEKLRQSLGPTWALEV